MSLHRFLHLGDLGLTVPAAAGIGAALLATGAWRMALCWSALFALAVGLVGASKIAFLGWGNALHGIDFKALSGHATTVTAVAPTLLYLVAQRRQPPLRAGAVALGLLAGAAMAWLLVVQAQHSVAEAAAGWAVGAAASLCVIGCAGGPAGGHPLAAWLAFALAFLLAAWLMRSAHVGYWMIRLALLLSGQHLPFAWDDATAAALPTSG